MEEKYNKKIACNEEKLLLRSKIKFIEDKKEK